MKYRAISDIDKDLAHLLTSKGVKTKKYELLAREKRELEYHHPGPYSSVPEKRGKK